MHRIAAAAYGMAAFIRGVIRNTAGLSGNKRCDHGWTVIAEPRVRIQAALVVVLCYCHDVSIGLCICAGS